MGSAQLAPHRRPNFRSDTGRSDARIAASPEHATPPSSRHPRPRRQQRAFLHCAQCDLALRIAVPGCIRVSTVGRSSSPTALFSCDSWIERSVSCLGRFDPGGALGVLSAELTHQRQILLWACSFKIGDRQGVKQWRLCALQGAQQESCFIMLF